jgi:hypothetical protein
MTEPATPVKSLARTALIDRLKDLLPPHRDGSVDDAGGNWEPPTGIGSTLCSTTAPKSKPSADVRQLGLAGVVRERSQ